MTTVHATDGNAPVTFIASPSRESVAETQLAAALLRLSLDRPYLTAALWSLHRVPTIAVETMAVDARWRLYYNPETVITEWDCTQTAAVLYHEICHLLRDHAGRAPSEVTGDEDAAGRWNLAADAEINDDLREEAIALPGFPIYPQTLGGIDGRTAEEYYTLIPPGNTPKLNRTGGDGIGGDISGNVSGRLGIGSGRCGSCAHGVPEGAETSGTMIPGVTVEEALLIRRAVAVEIGKVVAARGGGSLPGGWERWAEELLAPPTVDWRRELAAVVRHSLAETVGRTDYRYARPGRRQAAIPDIVVPSLVQYVPNVAIAIDTSGSMGSSDITQALSETAGIFRALGLRERVTVLSVDAAVHSCRAVFHPQQVKGMLRGGGGTDMGVALQAAERLRPRPDIFVVLTDGYTPWPNDPPQRVGQVIVVLTNSQGPTAPAWARSIRATPKSNALDHK